MSDEEKIKILRESICSLIGHRLLEIYRDQSQFNGSSGPYSHVISKCQCCGEIVDETHNIGLMRYRYENKSK